MNYSKFVVYTLLGATLAALSATGCSDDSSDEGTDGGAAGKAGGGAGGKGGQATAGSSSGNNVGGSTGGTSTAGSSSGGDDTGGTSNAGQGGGGTDAGGSAGSGGAGEGGGGSGGDAGNAGEAGSAGDAGSGGEGGGGSAPCAPTVLTKPTVAEAIKVTDAAVLVAAYGAVGTQTYTCTATTVGQVTTYAWSAASVPTANLYNAACELVGTHYAGPHWKSNDNSIIKGTRRDGVASATAGSIQQLLLSAEVDGGSAGIFTPITAIQRLDTVGGVAPATGCDVDHPTATIAVDYTANYYFYSGVTIPVP